jgi:hypothetical protein
MWPQADSIDGTEAIIADTLGQIANELVLVVVGKQAGEYEMGYGRIDRVLGVDWVIITECTGTNA